MKNIKLIYITLFIVLFSSIKLFGQEKTITLNTNFTGSTHNKVARDLISLEPGFEYTSSSTTSFTASLDDKLICNTEYVTNPIAGTDRTLSTSKNVGSIPGSYSVSPNGAASYLIPINLPAGVNGMAPSLVINYNSQANNGLLGWGWNLSGLSIITRGTTSLMQEDSINRVTLSNSDRFFLDGQRLILTKGTYGNDGSEYRTEIDVVAKVKLKSNNGSLFFEVHTANGKIITYGKYQYARKETSSESIVYWCMDETTDLNGNQINYLYKESNDQLIIDQINYAGNTIDFYYEDRSENDANTTYIYGEELKSTNLLTEIKVKADGQNYREYGFNYTKDLYSLLSEVTLKAGNGSEINSTIINWNTKTFSPLKDNLALNLNYIKYYGDFNGDGRTDILTKATADIDFKVLISDNTLKGYNEFELDLPEHYRDLKIGDFDNDGDDDIYVGYVDITSTRIDGLPVFTETITYSFYQYTSNQFIENNAKKIVHSENADNNYKPFLLNADFNGDGKMDYIIFDQQLGVNGTYNYSVIEKSFSNPGGYLQQFTDLNEVLFITVLNFNGNATLDLLVTKSEGTRVYEYSKNAHKFNDVSGLMSRWFSNYYQIGDFNGDGLSDFSKHILTSGSMGIYYSTGKGFEVKAGPFTLEEPENIEYPYEVVNSVDMNNDGKTDLVRFYFTVSRTIEIIDGSEWAVFKPVIHVKAYLCTGTKFIEKDITNLFSDFVFNSRKFIGKPSTINGENFDSDFDLVLSINNISFNDFPKISMFDFNGDGNGDMILKRPQDDTYQCLSLVTGEKERMVKMVTSGMNQNTEFKYSTLFDNDLYTRTSAGTYPVFNIKAPLYVVKNVNLLDDGNIYNKLSYSYTDAKIHRQLGFIGFSSIESVDSLTNTAIRTEYSYIGSLFTPSPLTVNKKLKGGNNISTITYDIAEQEYSALNNTKYYQLRATKEINTNYLTSTTITTNNNNYNLYNKPNQIIKTYGTDDLIVTKDITYSSEVSDDNWLPLRVGAITLTKQRKGESGSFSETTEFDFDDSSNPHLITSKIIRKGSDQELTENYQYENFGALKKVELVKDTITHSAEYVYTSNNKFIKIETTNNKFPQEYTYDAAGNVLTKINHNNHTTSYEYDDFGSLIKTTLPDGKVITKSKIFDDNEGNFHTETSITGKGETKEYYNRKGQLLSKKVPGALNKTYTTDYEYFDNGKLRKQYMSYESIKDDFTEFTYDAYGRNTSEITPQGTTTINYNSYGSKTVRITTPGSWTEKTIDNTSLVTKVQDEGGIISYKYNNRGLVRKLDYDGNEITMEYNDAGNRTLLNDPNTGKTLSTYNAFGELISTTDAKSNVYAMQYDTFGRISSKTCNDETTSWAYNSESGVLDSISNNETTISYAYDKNWLNLEKQTETIKGKNFETSFTYNTNNDVATVTYPGGFGIENIYDNNGYRTKIKRVGTSTIIWELKNVNDKGMIINYTYGNGISTTLNYDDKYRPSEIVTSNANIHHWKYSFNDDGNLEYRRNENRFVQEDFTYDDLNRLTSYWDGTISYADNGNINTKPDIGTYNYQATQPNAVSKITSPNTNYNPIQANISYTSFDKVSEISDLTNTYKLALTYGTNQQRKIMKTYESGSLKQTKYYSGSYEKIVDVVQGTKELTYISAGSGLAAVFIKDFDNSEKLYYIHSDYLGSVMALTNESGVKVEEYFYNAWGQRRNPNDWTQNDTRTNLIVDRGYTGHEHLDHFDLINMNGRVYDPDLGRFLSPDPLMQATDYSQNFNKFSYVYNNPLVFSDPTGEFAFALVIIAAWYGGMQGLNQVGRSNHHATWQDFAKGWLIGSSIGAGAGAAGVGGSYIVSVGWSAAYGAACGATTGAYNALAFDGNVGTSALYGGIIGGFTGWISGLQQHEYAQSTGVPDPNQYPQYAGPGGGAQSNGIPITGQGNPSGQQIGGNSETQFYSNSSDAYKYMWTNSFDAKGNPIVEISAWKTDKGIIVMPYYKNGIDYSYNDYLKVKTIDGSRYVTYNDNQYLITGHVHTHPSYQNGNIGLSGGDYDMINYIHGPINVLWNNRIWQVNGKTSSPIDLGGW